MKRILAVGAHYDDIEIGCGGTIIKHAQKRDRIFFGITSSDEQRTGDMKDRYVEQVLSAGIIGIDRRDIFRFSYNNTIDEVHDIVGQLDYLKPDIVYTQHELDTHQDHKRASIIGQAVGRKRHITTVFYDSGSAYNFQPNVFSMIDFSSKEKLIKCFKSQIKLGAINIDIVKNKDLYWGSLISKSINKYAEGFMVRKMKWEI